MAETRGAAPRAERLHRRRVRPADLVRRLQRWLVFNAVGTMGVGVQLAVLVSLTEGLGLNYLVATVLAVESAILHNFVWHEHWTWRNRGPGIGGRWARLAWFNLVTGALSISSNVVLTALYVSTFGIHYAIANLMAIATCSLLTFVASDRFVFRTYGGGEDMTTGASVSKKQGRRPDWGMATLRVGMAVALAAAFPAGLAAAELHDETRAAGTGRESPTRISDAGNGKDGQWARGGNGDLMVNALQSTASTGQPADADADARGGNSAAFADRHRGPLVGRVALAAALLGGTAVPAAAAELQPQTVAAWNRYVEATERRIAAELENEHPDRFLARDFGDGAAEARREVLAGRIRIDELETRDVDGERIRVPKGAIHHWLGSALIPDVTLEEVLHALIHAVDPQELQDDVIESRVLARPGEDRLELFLKLRRKQIVTVHFNSEHSAAYTRHRPGLASSRSVATRIAELDGAGTPDEREKPVGRDRGFLWRLNTYWRYLQVDEGVIFEVESISLSRGIPRLLRWMVSPLINRTARDVMTQTLVSMADVLSARAPAAFATAARGLQP